MKALLFASCLLLLAVFSSCTKKNYYTTPSQTISFGAKSTDWIMDTASHSFVLSVNMPEITDFVNQNDAVDVSISYLDSTGQPSGQYETIPEAYAGVSYSYTYQVGTLNIYAQLVGGTITTVPPNDMTVKIVLIPSQQ